MPDRQDALLFFYKRGRGNRPTLPKANPRTLAYFGVMIVLIGLAGWLYLQQASQVAGQAHELRALELRKEQLHREIVALRAEVATLGSLQRVLDLGEQLGYSLPPALDPERWLHIEYQPAESPWAGRLRAESGRERAGGVSATPLETDSGKAKSFFRRILEQFETWMESPMDATDSKNRRVD